jgi:hypothetical protein
MAAVGWTDVWTTRLQQPAAAKTADAPKSSREMGKTNCFRLNKQKT